MKFTEAQLESYIIELLEAEGYPHVLGYELGGSSWENVAPAAFPSKRAKLELRPSQALIKADLRAFLAKQYAADHITPQEIEAVINQLEAYGLANCVKIAVTMNH